MDLVRSVARPMLASTFVVGGYGVLKDPASRVPVAEKVARPIADALPIDLPDDTEQLVKINAAVQVGAGVLLALGKFPRLSSVALAASLAPTTAAGHRFWEVDDQATRSQQLIHFCKNVSMLGGLLIAAADTGGRPSVPYRAGVAARRARDKADKAAARSAAAAAKAQARASRSAARGVGAVSAALPVGG